ncbi:MAG: PRD domain-containing protein [Oscillospiraceae bacterium]|nr:PRD domain-containing protein [Oscillospiraceae bacterium]
MEISSRTIFREISSINNALKEKQVKISVKNSALVYSGSEEEKEHLKQILGNVPKRLLLTPKQRILFITAQLLLADEPYKSAFFSYQLSVAEGTISLYMDSVEQWLKEKNLFLLRKRRYGIHIEGSEWNKRNALVALIYEYKPVEELLSYIYETEKEPVLHLFFRLLFGNRILDISKEMVQLIPEQTIDDVPYLTLLFHTMISVKKTLAKNPISLPDEFIQEALSANRFHFGEKLRQFLLQHDIPAVESEIAYISIHLPANCLYGTERNFTDLDVSVHELAEEVLYEIQRKMRVDLSGDAQLISGLVHYFSHAIYRTNMGIQVKNSLLNQVMEHYKALFKTVESACKLVFSKYNICLSKDEIAFITMDIGAALETKEEQKKKIAIQIICPNGLFASRILLNKIHGLVRDIDSVDIASMKDWKDSGGKKYDLILSTVDMGREGKQNRILVVSPFLSEDDVSRINNRVAMIRKRAGYRIGKSLPPPPKDGAGVDESGSIHRMIEHLWLETIPAEAFENIIGRISSGLCERDAAEDCGKIKSLILKREKIGSIVIPGTRVSLLHIRSDLVHAPYIGIYRLDGEIQMEGVGFVQVPVDTFLLMLARSNESPVVLEKMGKISISLIENKNFTKQLRTSGLNELRAVFQNLLEEIAEER